MAKQKKSTEEKEKKIKVSTLAYAIAIVLIVFVAIISVLAYGTQTEVGARIALKMSKIIPFPAAVVDWKNIVLLRDVQKNLASVEQFYQTQNFATEGLRVDFTTESGKKRLKIKEKEILDKMIEDRAIEILAKRQGIFISEKDADQAVAQKLIEFGTEEEIKEDLLRSYGWSMEDFKERVVLPSMYSDALAQKVMTDNQADNSQSKEKISKAQNELASGKDFAEVARKYSEGASKDEGGELGWVKSDQVVPELKDVLFGGQSMKKNDIIESSIGFHIVEIEDRKSEDGQDILQLRQVFVAKNTFAGWLVEQKKNMKIWVPLSYFFWDSKVGAVDFRDEKMRNFEKEQRAKAQGDASIMF